MSVVLIISLILLLIINRLIFAKSTASLPWYIDPMTWISVPWIISLTTFALPIFSHRESFQLYHYIYVFGCFLIFFIGNSIPAFALSNTKAQTPTSHKEDEIPSHLLMLSLAILGTIGYGARMFDQISVSGLSIIERLTSPSGLEMARQFRNAASTTGKQGPLALLEFLSVFSLFFLVYYFYNAFSATISSGKKRIYKTCAIILVFIITFNSIVIEAGRVELLIFTLIMLSSVLLDEQRSLIKYIKSFSRSKKLFLAGTGIFIALTGITLLATVFLKARVGNVAPELLLVLVHRAKFDPFIAPLIDDYPSIQLALLQLSYITVPIATLVYFLDLSSSQFPGPFYGIANFPGLLDRILFEIDKSLYAPDWYPQADQYLTLYGFAGNVWSTLLRDLALDFTRPGVLIYMFFFGMLVSYFVRKSFLHKSVSHVLMSAVMLTMLGFSAFHTISSRAIIFKTLEIGMLILFYKWFSRKFSSKNIHPNLKNQLQK
jgi:hypothetical protein